ncbi:lipoprotein insertase outer membrane protein LolB [Alkalimarinus alittae]|uniref:Outer-membrane lipoprotein LolB n=1 Tax=Alkalimarinus alittae TaxID=2961619 RepID=A0ABY6N4A2_9ALTE|nr:lipoprotein insertase outer membrane protein LolB [Alkalimarinus alittae]UZE96958.1 lipoprotein insertase outer membrane protein LolB [Alkalimarinus alittae]
MSQPPSNHNSTTKMRHSALTSKPPFWAFSFLLVLLIQGCASTPETPLTLTLTQPHNWQTTIAQISAIDHWAFSGKIGVRVPERIDSAVINRWQQDDNQFTIDLSSAIFGLGATRIEGNPDFITMTESGEEPITSYNPRGLIQQHIGWPLPIAQLRYWVKGIPAPERTQTDQVTALKFDDKGQLSQLNQNGWQINLSKYALFGQVNLPRKVVLRQHQAKITVIINEWQLH